MTTLKTTLTMTTLKILGAAAILAATVAAPVNAREAVHHHRAHAQIHQWSNETGYDYRRGDSGFWPGDVAAGVIGGAIGTAGAIATAPFRGEDSYAYYNGYDRSPGYYRPRSSCGMIFGGTYQGPDGRWYPC